MVAHVRRQVFGGEAPPFTSDRDATAWLRAACGEVSAAGVLTAAQQQLAPLTDAWFAWWDGAPQYARLTHTATVQYIEAPSGERFLAPWNRPVETVRRAAADLADYTLWPMGSLVRYVLTGTRPPDTARGRIWHQAV